MNPDGGYDYWIVCPGCFLSMIGDPGEKCPVCGSVMLESPLYDDVDWEEVGIHEYEQYTKEERDLIEELCG